LLLLGAVIAVASPAGVYAASGRYLDPVFSSRRDANLQYGTATHPDGTREKLRLDLYRPVGDTARYRPVVIYVHGGDYTVSKNVWRQRIVGEMFAKRGFVAAVIQYRTGANGLSREAAWDLRAAARWFRKNAGWLNISPNRIVVMGTSAGATAALSATFDSTDVGPSPSNPSYSSAVAAGISMSGTAGDYSDINAGDPPIAMLVAKDDHPFWEGTLTTCNYTRALGNVCDLYEFPDGGHPPPFFFKYRSEIIEDSARFVCARVLGPVVCHDANGDGRVD
jgi:acetyl esterase/lipase